MQLETLKNARVRMRHTHTHTHTLSLSLSLSLCLSLTHTHSLTHSLTRLHTPNTDGKPANKFALDEKFMNRSYAMGEMDTYVCMLCNIHYIRTYMHAHPCTYTCTQDNR